ALAPERYRNPIYKKSAFPGAGHPRPPRIGTSAAKIQSPISNLQSLILHPPQLRPTLATKTVTRPGWLAAVVAVADVGLLQAFGRRFARRWLTGRRLPGGAEARPEQNSRQNQKKNGGGHGGQ